jgi:hypothetical protein
MGLTRSIAGGPDWPIGIVLAPLTATAPRSTIHRDDEGLTIVNDEVGG